MSLPNNIELCMIVLSRDPVRLNNFKTMKECFPQLKYFEAVDWKKHWDFILSFIKNNHIPIKKLRPKKNTKGKYARWMSVILFAKYVIDTNSKGAILIEDDVLLPKNFNFKYDSYKDCNFCKLSKWGEGYFMNNIGAVKLLQSIYRIGIDNSNDVFIIFYHIYDKWITLILLEHLINGKKKGNIWSGEYSCLLAYENWPIEIENSWLKKPWLKKPPLITNTFFTDGLDRYNLVMYDK